MRLILAEHSRLTSVQPKHDPPPPPSLTVDEKRRRKAIAQAAYAHAKILIDSNDMFSELLGHLEGIAKPDAVARLTQKLADEHGFLDDTPDGDSEPEGQHRSSTPRTSRASNPYSSQSHSSSLVDLVDSAFKKDTSSLGSSHRGPMIKQEKPWKGRDSDSTSDVIIVSSDEEFDIRKFKKKRKCSQSWIP
ncbi:hypothetical protein M422DRAFT_248593 [Sphaerobolus stellatus SS14]|nr:hypothetical protein M422DRAFT_248593 [Sphaerobolus stellatus SS14]